MSPRVIQLPMSGRDRRHYARELRAAEQEQRGLVERVKAAHSAADEALRLAHDLECQEWNARQFIGGDADPSPTIANAIHGGRGLLEVHCQTCGHTSRVDLPLAIWPREKQVHTLKQALACQACNKSTGRKVRPNLVALHLGEPPETPNPARRPAKRTG